MRPIFRRVILAVFAVAAGRVVEADARLFEVGLLAQVGADRPQIRGFRDGLKEAGYVEGTNLRLSMGVSSSLVELQSVAKAYIQKKVDVIVTTGGVETSVAKEVTQDIPTVFMPVIDPVKSGFIKSLSHPGTNMTGLSFTADGRAQGKQLEIFKQIVPNLQRLIVLYDKRHPAALIELNNLRPVAEHLKVRVDETPVESAADAVRAVSLMRGTRHAGIYLVCSSLFANPIKLSEIARQRRIPFHSCIADQVTNGIALFAYARDFYAIGHRASWYVNRILSGAKPQDLPVETPTKFELVINLRVAREIGVRINPEVLQQADKVIQ